MKVKFFLFISYYFHFILATPPLKFLSFNSLISMAFSCKKKKEKNKYIIIIFPLFWVIFRVREYHFFHLYLYFFASWIICKDKFAFLFTSCWWNSVLRLCHLLCKKSFILKLVHLFITHYNWIYIYAYNLIYEMVTFLYWIYGNKTFLF